jgi:serine phosphatase RsbU (regulator of sigma subunit)
MKPQVKHPELDALLIEAANNETALFALAGKYAHSVADNWVIAEYYHNEIHKVCDKWSDGCNIAAGVKELISSLYYYYTTQFQLVGDVAVKAIEILQNHNEPDLLGVAYMIQGTNLRSLGVFDKGVEILGKACRLIDEKGPFRIYFSFAHYQLAEIFVQLKDYELAEINYIIAKDVAETASDTTAFFRTTNGLGNLYMATEEFDKAFEFLNESLEISQSNTQKSRAFCDLGIYYLKVDNPQKSFELTEQSYTLRKEDGYEDAASTSLIHVGNALLALGKLEEAENRCNESLVIIEKFNSKSKKILALELLGKIKEKQGEWKDAVSHIRQNQILKEDLNNQQMRNIYKMKNAMILGQKELIEEAHKEITDSIAYAKRIQTAILPPSNMMKERLKDHFVLYKPKDVVAGDFYWLEETAGTVLFASADCTGHGVPGAMVSVVCNNALNRSVREYGLKIPGDILDKTREIVIQEFEKSEEEVKDGMDIGLCALRGKTLQFSAAHNPLWLIRDKELIEYKGDKQPVGKFINAQPFTTTTIELQSGDVFYIMTDGFVDQFGGPKGKKFKAKNLKEILLNIHAKPLEKQRLLLDEAFEDWRGTLEQIDDVCLIGVSI